MIFANTIGGDGSIQKHVYGIENTDSNEQFGSPNNMIMCAQWRGKGKTMKVFAKFEKEIAPDLIQLAIKDPLNDIIYDLDYDIQIEVLTIAEICVSKGLDPVNIQDYQNARALAEGYLSECLDDLFYNSSTVENYMRDSIDVIQNKQS